MELEITSEKCIACRACEFACSYHMDGDFSSIGSSIMIHRDERKDYFGPILKRSKDILLGRPERIEILKPGQSTTGGAAANKPILMRGPCDLCPDEKVPFCVAICPTGCLRKKE
ncbi:MAG: hypothetical protein NT009_01000 [Proteobacteria bacterium]|jgi:ferredoxin|nr:hypothetical protein [Pseudomonadota bacterium]